MYPDSAGYKRTGTSQVAANTTDAAKYRHMTFNALLVRDMSADEIADFLQVDRLTIRPRCSELRKSGKIEDTGKRCKNASGKPAIIWRAIRDKPRQGFLFTTERDASAI